MTSCHVCKTYHFMERIPHLAVVDASALSYRHCMLSSVACGFASLPSGCMNMVGEMLLVSLLSGAVGGSSSFGRVGRGALRAVGWCELLRSDLA